MTFSFTLLQINFKKKFTCCLYFETFSVQLRHLYKQNLINKLFKVNIFTYYNIYFFIFFYFVQYLMRKMLPVWYTMVCCHKTMYYILSIYVQPDQFPLPLFTYFVQNLRTKLGVCLPWEKMLRKKIVSYRGSDFVSPINFYRLLWPFFLLKIF